MSRKVLVRGTSSHEEFVITINRYLLSYASIKSCKYKRKLIYNLKNNMSLVYFLDIIII